MPCLRTRGELINTEVKRSLNESRDVEDTELLLVNDVITEAFQIIDERVWEYRYIHSYIHICVFQVCN